MKHTFISEETKKIALDEYLRGDVSMKQISAKYGICHGTFYLYKKKNKEYVQDYFLGVANGRTTNSPTLHEIAGPFVQIKQKEIIQHTPQTNITQKTLTKPAQKKKEEEETEHFLDYIVDNKKKRGRPMTKQQEAADFIATDNFINYVLANNNQEKVGSKGQSKRKHNIIIDTETDKSEIQIYEPKKIVKNNELQKKNMA